MRKLAGKSPPSVSRAKVSEASRLRSRLGTYYKRRRRRYAEEVPDFFDSDLRRLFAHSSAAPSGERAAAFLRRSRKPILDAVSGWSGEPKFTVNRLLRELTERCAELNLRLRADFSDLEIAAYLATLVSHYRLTGKFKRS